MSLIMMVVYYSIFCNVVLPPADKPVLKIPSKMKEALKETKTSFERRLKEEQKVVSKAKRHLLTLFFSI